MEDVGGGNSSRSVGGDVAAALIGLIHFRLEPRPHQKKNKKRKHSDTTSKAAPTGYSAGGGRGSCDDDKETILRDNNSHQGSSIPIIGYVLEIQREEQQLPPTPHVTAAAGRRREEFLLSIPRDLMEIANRALRYGLTVRIRRYKLLPLCEDEIPHTSIGTSSNINNLLLMPKGLVEVHSSGLEILGGASHHPAASQSNGPIDVWTLAQIRKREAADRIQKQNQTLPPSCTSGQRYCFRAAVNSVSPIITIDPSDPFSLVELHDPQSTCSCVAVIRKCALACHAAILPGRLYSLINVKRQQWRIPDMLVKKILKHLQNRVPSYVFVIDNIDQIRWTNDDDNEDGGNNNSVPFVPPHPLESLRGEVISVHTIHVGDDKDHIHYIELKPLQGDANNSNNGRQRSSFTLFLTYYPMPSALQLGLRPGAHVEALNIHSISCWSYCACLRSSISLIRHASEQPSSAAVSSAQQIIYLSLSKTSPCDFLKVKRTYMEFLCRQQLSILLQDFSSLAPGNDDCPVLPSVDAFTAVLLGTGKISQEAGARNAYAEFFDHALEEDDDEDQKVGGCQATQCSDVTVPLVVRLSNLVESSMRFLESRLVRLTTSLSAKEMQVGSTGSLIHSTQELERALDDDSFCFLGPSTMQRAPMELIHVLGVASLSNTDGKVRGDLTNGRYTVPILVADHGLYSVGGKQQFAMTGVRAVILSFICIEAPVKRGSSIGQGSTVKTVYLPRYDRVTRLGSGQQDLSSCAFIACNGYLFVASAYLECQQLTPIGACEAVEKFNERSPFSGGSVRGCLDPNMMEEDSEMIVGLLSRKFFKIAKIRNSTYNGFMIRLSHVHSLSEKHPHISLEEICTLQSIEMKPVAVVDQSKYHIIRQLLDSTFGKSIREEQTTVVLVWWKTASCASTCALLGGGWDEIIAPEATLTARSMGVLVRFPRSAVQPDIKRGFVRFRCNLEALTSSTTAFSQDTSPLRFRSPSSPMDFIGGRRFLPGMLSCRPRRRALSHDRDRRVAYGELLVAPRYSGVPSCSLADLHWDICADLRERSRLHLAPSLVREIRNAAFLGISYCRALAECTKCFQALKMPAFANGKKAKSKQSDGIVTSVKLSDGSDTAKSFWNQPLLQNQPKTGTNISGTVNRTPSEPPVHISTQSKTKRRTQMRCPNNCSLDDATIKWECSGTLDDGTGQAKLYAERDTALMLLGTASSVVEEIEAGAWEREKGIIFSKNMPPKKYLRSAIKRARAMAQDHVRYINAGRVQEADVLRYMTTEARADYWMERHCRDGRGKATTSERTYYVRCKPLADEMAHCLNRTQIDLITTTPAAAAAGGSLARYDDDSRLRLGKKPVPIYTLPPLKLNLVDCCCGSNSATEDDDE